MTHPELKALRARAHALVPALIVGEAGVSEGVLAELDRLLSAQGLVKVRFSNRDRATRKAQRLALCEGCGAEVVLAIGKVVTCWREPAEEPAEEPATP